MNLVIRLGTAAVFIPLLIALIWWGPIWIWLLVFLVAPGLAAYELVDFSQPEGHRRERVVSVLGVAAVSGVLCLWPSYVVLALLSATVVIAATHLFALRDIDSAASRLALALSPLLLVGVPMGLLSRIRFLQDGPGWVTLTLLATWFGDTGGYFFGKYLGKNGRKLYPAVSPNKTWMGALGTVAGALLAATVASLWFMSHVNPVAVFIVALAVAPAGIVGDLVESLFKRSFDIKDSGKALPGHGGLLDRIDALLFSAPVVYYLVWLLQSVAAT